MQPKLSIAQRILDFFRPKHKRRGPSRYHSLKIHANAPCGFGSTIHIDGQRLRGVRYIGLRCPYDNVTTVTVELIASVEVDGEVSGKGLVITPETEAQS